MNILWLNSRLMFPLDQGGKIRTYHTLKHLCRRHAIAVVTPVVLPGEATAIPGMSQVCRELHVVPVRPTARRGSARFALELGANLFSKWPYSLARYRSRGVRRKVAALLASGLSTGPVDVVVCDFLTPTVNLPDTGGVPVVLFAHNVETVIWERLAETERRGLRRRYFRGQAARMRRAEGDAARRAALVIAVSTADRDLFRREFGVERVEAVPTGVDTEYFAPSDDWPALPEIVFVGSMDWMPNEDASIQLMEEILPRVRQSVPEARLTLVGKSPSDRMVRAASAAGKVVVTGRVDDVRPYLGRSRVVVVPLRVGGGTRIKIFEAMAAGRPVVSTTIGAEGLPVTHGRDCLIADRPADFAEAVVEVLTDERLARRLAEGGRRLVEERFDWSHAAEAFDRLLVQAVGQKPPAAAPAR